MHGVRPGGFHYETSVLRFWQCIWCCFQVFRHLFFWKEATRHLSLVVHYFDILIDVNSGNGMHLGMVHGKKTDWRDIFREKSPLNVAIVCISWDVGWEWFHDTEDWKDWNWNQDPGCPKIKKMTWRFCFFKKKSWCSWCFVAKHERGLESTVRIWRKIVGLEHLGIHARDRAESCFTVDVVRVWGLFGLDHDMADLQFAMIVLIMFWIIFGLILPIPESLFSRFFTEDKWFPVCLRQVMVDFTSPIRGTWSALLLKSLYPGEFASLLFTAVEGRLILQIRWNYVDFVHPWGPCCKLESAHSDSQQKGREIFIFQCWHDNCS